MTQNNCMFRCLRYKIISSADFFASDFCFFYIGKKLKVVSITNGLSTLRRMLILCLTIWTLFKLTTPRLKVAPLPPPVNPPSPLGRYKRFLPKTTCKRTQHCWMLRVGLRVACRCAKFETGQPFSPVERDATLLANNSQHCWG